MRKEKTDEKLSLVPALLAERVSKKTGVKLERVKETISAFFVLAKQSVLDTGSFKLQSLGTFTRMFVEERERKNSETGETVVTPANYKVKFVPAASLARRINKPYEQLKPEVIEELSAKETGKKENAQTNQTPKDRNEKENESKNAETKRIRETKNVSKRETEKAPKKETQTVREAVAPKSESANRESERVREEVVRESERAKAEAHTAPESAADQSDLGNAALIDSKDEVSSLFDSDTVDDAFQADNCDFSKLSESPFPFDDEFSRSETKTFDTRERSDFESGNAAKKNAAVPSGKDDERVIEKQIIRQQIVQRQIVQTEKRADNFTEDAACDFNKNGDNGEMDVEKAVRRWWFFAGISALAAFLMITLLVVAVFLSKENGTASPAGTSTVIRKKRGSAQNAHDVQIAASDNVYASLSFQEYGEANLWPYIFSANMLRFPDPDKPGLAHEIIIPPKPDKALDKKDIELSVMDVYDSYRALIEKENRKKQNAVRNEHAVMALLCGESLYAGFIDTYAVRIENRDVKAARALLKNEKRRKTPLPFEN